MKRLLSIFAVVFVVVIGCQSTDTETAVEPRTTQPPPTEEPPPTAVPPTETAPPPTEEPQAADFSELEQALQGVVDAQVDAGFPGAILMVDAPDLGFSWKGAAGMADIEGEIPMEPETPFHVSGISDTLMAALVLKLAEEGIVGLDDPISQYLDAAIVAQLNGPDGEPYGEAITVRHLLKGTSGVAGYFLRDEEDKDRSNTPDFIEIIVEDPDKVWQPEEIIAYTTANLSPSSAPGEKYAANDLGGVLLGMIVETVTGSTLNEAYQTRLFEPLGMENTFAVQGSDRRIGDIAHAYLLNSVDVTDNASLSWFSNDVVSTVTDLDRFMRAWADDKIFSDPASKEAMMDWTSMADAGYEGLYYGPGLIKFDFAQTELPEIGDIMFQVSDWNGFVYYLPQHNVVLIGTLNRVMPFTSYDELAFPAVMAILPYVTEG